MEDVVELLDELQSRALKDETLKQRLLATQNHSSPLAEFCRVCQEAGYPIYEMELICAGEDFYASMKRSTNGGGENSPMLDGQDDFYELFMAALR